ncbi:unnamed protein product, partial [Trichogramma brassicae]
ISSSGRRRYNRWNSNDGRTKKKICGKARSLVNSRYVESIYISGIICVHAPQEEGETHYATRECKFCREESFFALGVCHRRCCCYCYCRCCRRKPWRRLHECTKRRIVYSEARAEQKKEKIDEERVHIRFRATKLACKVVIVGLELVDSPSRAQRYLRRSSRAHQQQRAAHKETLDLSIFTRREDKRAEVRGRNIITARPSARVGNDKRTFNFCPSTTIYRYYTVPSDTNEFLVRQRSVARRRRAIQFPHESCGACDAETLALARVPRSFFDRGCRGPRPSRLYTANTHCTTTVQARTLHIFSTLNLFRIARRRVVCHDTYTHTGRVGYDIIDRRATENESSAKEKAAAVVRGPRDPRPISPRLPGK